MSKTKVLVATAVAAVMMANASAVTFAELAEKNTRYLALKTDIAIAKAEAELAEQKRAKLGTPIAGAGANVPAIEQGKPGGPSRAPAAPPVAPPEAEIYLNAIHGAEGNLEADFQRQMLAISRKRGEPIFDGWQVTSIAYPRVQVTKRAATAKQKDICKSVPIGSSIAAAPAC